jgi:4'-phosphopantetheinyl transferase
VLVYGRIPAWLPRRGDIERLRPLLGRDWDRYASLAQPRMRERFLVSRLLLRHVAAAALETAPHLVDLSYQPGGRPYVRGCDQIDVSLSHTEEMMVVGITRRGRIGVDVERADRRLAGTGCEPQACTPYEKQQLDAGGDGARNDILVRLWTLKEAYSKALGQGLRFRFTEFGFALQESGARLVRPDGTPTGGTEWTFGTFTVDERYVVSAAVYDAGFGELADLSVRTTLDEGLLDALLGVPAPGAPGRGPGGPSAGSSGDPAGLFGDADGVDAVAGGELVDDGREVVADGALGEVQTAGDLRGIGSPGGEP